MKSVSQIRVLHASAMKRKRVSLVMVNWMNCLMLLLKPHPAWNVEHHPLMFVWYGLTFGEHLTFDLKADVFAHRESLPEEQPALTAAGPDSVEDMNYDIRDKLNEMGLA